MTRMKGVSGWTPPHDQEHDEDSDCRPAYASKENWCVPLEEESAKPSYDPPPSHYDGGAIDVWAIVDAYGLDYYLGNVLKYICRAGKKSIAPRLDDLIKARNFLLKAIELEEQRHDG